MSQLLEMLTAWEALRALFWGALVMVPLVFAFAAGQSSLQVYRDERAPLFWWVGVLIQAVLICCFYGGVIK